MARPLRIEFSGVFPKKLYEYEACASSRNEAIGLAYRSGGYTPEAIGKYYGLHYSTVSRIIHNRMQE